MFKAQKKNSDLHKTDLYEELNFLEKIFCKSLLLDVLKFV